VGARVVVAGRAPLVRGLRAGVRRDQQLAATAPVKPGTLAALERVLDGCGWDEVGGRLIRADGDSGPVVGRTVWIARADWWHDRPFGLTEKRARAVVELALHGCRLGDRQRRYLSFLVGVAEAAASDNTGRF
jgi:hypothetical protein